MISPQKSLLNLSCRPCDMHCYVRSYAWRLCGNARCRRSEMCRQVPRTGTGTFLQRERRNQYKRTKEMEVLLKVEYAVICCVIFMCSISIYIHIILYSQLNEALNNKCSMGGIPLNPTKNALIYLLLPLPSLATSVETGFFKKYITKHIIKISISKLDSTCLFKPVGRTVRCHSVTQLRFQQIDALLGQPTS